MDRVIQDVRNLSLDLRPAMLDDLGLASAVRWYAERQAERAGFQVDLVSESTAGDVPTEVKNACFRVVQEALTNVVRYGKARRVGVKLHQCEDEVEVLVQNDGIGFDVALESNLNKWGHKVVATSNGLAAWAALQEADAPPLAVLDWMMPDMDGPEVCRRLRAHAGSESVFVILLKAKGTKQDVVTELQAGADDYLTKPFDHIELHARLQVGQRILSLQTRLADRVSWSWHFRASSSSSMV